MLKFILNYKLPGPIVHKLNEIERFQGLWEYSVHKQSPHFIKELKQTAIITSSGASTRIEGALLSDDEVKELVDKGCKINSMSSKSEREVSGYVKALKYIYDNFQSLTISENTIRELHQILTSDLLEEHIPLNQRGAYKNITNDVVEKNNETGVEKVWFRTTPPGPTTDVEMRTLISDLQDLFANKELNKLVVIGSFVVVFLAIHPFRDGNGRLSRLLTVWLLLKAGYEWAQYSSHEKVIEDNKNYYYVQVRNTQNTLRSEPKFDDWFTFFFMVLDKQNLYLKQKLMAASPRSQMNLNESKVLEIIREHSIVSPAFLLEHVELSSTGLKNLLKRLTDKNLIIPIGEKRGRKYKINDVV